MSTTVFSKQNTPASEVYARTLVSRHEWVKVEPDILSLVARGGTHNYGARSWELQGPALQLTLDLLSHFILLCPRGVCNERSLSSRGEPPCFFLFTSSVWKHKARVN